MEKNKIEALGKSFRINCRKIFAVLMKPSCPQKAGISSSRGKIAASLERLRFLLHPSSLLERQGVLKREIKKLIIFLNENPLEALILALILFSGSFFRLYRISEYMTFLGDEGRDAIIVRRLLVFGHPPLIGPGTSVGNMYLGPLYYYMMAPALLLARFSPVGPAILIALLGVLTILLIFIICREWFGPISAILAAALYAVSPVIIIYSRSSWNPNIMPFFSLSAVYSIWRVWKYKDAKWLLALAVSYAFVLQSHYLGLLLGPTIFLIWVLSFNHFKKSKGEKLKEFLQYTAICFGLFALLMSPLLIFDARHDWRNFLAMKAFFFGKQSAISLTLWDSIPKIWPTFVTVFGRLLAGKNMFFGELFGVLFLFGSILALILVRNAEFILLLIWIGFALLGLSFYKQDIYDHYFGFFFAAPFMASGYLGQLLIEKLRRLGKVVVIFLFFVLIYLDFGENPLRYPPNRQLQKTQNVAKKIVEESGGLEFNFAVLAKNNYESGYKYFLLLWGAPVVDIDPLNATKTITRQLFVVCELTKEKCDPTHSPKADIANFGWSKIDKEWEIEGIVLYKLTHSK